MANSANLPAIFCVLPVQTVFSFNQVVLSITRLELFVKLFCKKISKIIEFFKSPSTKPHASVQRFSRRTS